MIGAHELRSGSDIPHPRRDKARPLGYGQAGVQVAFEAPAFLECAASSLRFRAGETGSSNRECPARPDERRESEGGAGMHVHV